MRKELVLGLLAGSLLLTGCAGAQETGGQTETSGVLEATVTAVSSSAETEGTATEAAASEDAEVTEAEAIVPEDTGTPETTEGAEETVPIEETVSQETEETLSETAGRSAEGPEIQWGEPQETGEGLPQLPDKFTYIPEQTLYVAGDGKLRSQPSQVFKAEKKLKPGDTVQCIAESPDGWKAVILKDQVFYMRDLSKEPPQPTEPEKVITEEPREDLVYTNHWVNLRKGPDASTEGLGKIPERTELQRLAVCSNGWSKVRYEGQIGYVAGMYLSDTMPPELETGETAASVG